MGSFGRDADDGRAGFEDEEPVRTLDVALGDDVLARGDEDAGHARDERERDGFGEAGEEGVRSHRVHDERGRRGVLGNDRDVRGERLHRDRRALLLRTRGFGAIGALRVGGGREAPARVRGRADAFHAVVAIVAPTSGGASGGDVVAAHALGVREARLRAAHGERLGAIGPRGREREEGRREGAARATREDGNGPRGVALTKETPGAAGDEATRSSLPLSPGWGQSGRAF